ncbi:hypothetical protein ACQVP2_07505 [Methylobacterium aquaticum]|uniref:hypothetical protein n=1 Tax=Methylobacterium aquaticum TaxID=270351 RepID=UPI003D16C973
MIRSPCRQCGQPLRPYLCSPKWCSSTRQWSEDDRRKLKGKRMCGSPTGGGGLKPPPDHAELQRQLDGYRHHLDQCAQIAGKALGYPWFKDDQQNFPGSTDADGVCIGDHVGDSIVEELARAYEAVKAERDALKAAADRLTNSDDGEGAA